MNTEALGSVTLNVRVVPGFANDVAVIVSGPSGICSVANIAPKPFDDVETGESGGRPTRPRTLNASGAARKPGRSSSAATQIGVFVLRFFTWGRVWTYIE